MPNVEKRKCLQPGCPASGAHRGLCIKHYGQAKKLVEGGKATWEQLASLNLVEPEVTEFEQVFLLRKQRTEEQ